MKILVISLTLIASSCQTVDFIHWNKCLEICDNKYGLLKVGHNLKGRYCYCDDGDTINLPPEPDYE